MDGWNNPANKLKTQSLSVGPAWLPFVFRPLCEGGLSLPMGKVCKDTVNCTVQKWMYIKEMHTGTNLD